MLTNLAGAALSGAGNKGHAEGTTQAAVSGGSVVIRDQANQKQDVNQLSRDTENANGSIGLIFDKEKEQNRLKQAQLIGEIAGQTMDVIRTQGDINGLKAAKDKHPGLDAKALRKTPEYQAEMKEYGTGSDIQRAAQAVTGALQALAGNNLAGALASGAAPYLAREIKARIGDDNVAANAMAHAVLGAIAAQLNNQSAVAGAVGAGGGELAARVIVEIRFPGRDTTLTDAQASGENVTVDVGRNKAAEAALKKGDLAEASSLINKASGEISAKTPTGSKGNPLIVPDGINKPTIIGNREFSGHSLDRMQKQGITPTVVDNAIKPENAVKGKVPGTAAYHDKNNNLTVIVDEKSGRVVTVDFGIIKQ